MPIKKRYGRILYEKINIYVYCIIPLIVISLYLIISRLLDFDLNKIQTFNGEIINISLTLTGVLLTLMAIFASFSNSEFIKYLKEYKHEIIFYRTIFCGIVFLLITIIISVMEILTVLKPIFFLAGFTETIIVTKKVYDILVNLDN